ncbi:MAG: YCF48-related protein [Saprospiraceae bacterium]
MKKVALLFFLFTYCMGQAQDWSSIDLGTDEELSKIYFIDDETGFIIGQNGTLFKTSDGGDNWIGIPTGVSHHLHTISFANQNVGFINGLKTTDGGNNWSIQSASEEFGLIKALDEENLIGGDYLYFHGEVYKSYNGGSTWETIADPVETGFYTDAYFINDSLGYMTSWYSGNLVKTTDGGESWTEVTSIKLINPHNQYGVTFPSSDIGVVTSKNHIAKTIDGGATWVSIYSHQDNNIFFTPGGIFSTSEDNYIVIGGHIANVEEVETIYETTDGGTTWNLSNTSDNRLNDVTCIGDKCYAVGWNGTVLTKSNDVVNTNHLLSEVVTIDVYPNPVTDHLQIKVDEMDIEGIEILDLLGKVHGKYSWLGNSVFVGNLAKGVYLLKVKFAGGEKVIKIEKI